jgi:hypothetical protein
MDKIITTIAISTSNNSVAIASNSVVTGSIVEADSPNECDYRMEAASCERN